MGLTPTLFKSPGLRGLEELHLCMTGPWSLLHISHLTKLTNLSLGFSETDAGDCEGMHQGMAVEVNIPLQLPVSLRRLRAASIGTMFLSEMKTTFSHLTNLTSFAYRPYICIDDYGYFDEFPELPVAPEMLELDLSGFSCMSSVIPDHMPEVTKLLLGDIDSGDASSYGFARVFEDLKGLRHLQIISDSCVFSAAASLQVLSWELSQYCTPDEVVRLSCLTCLTDLTVTIGSVDVYRPVDVCRAVVDLSSSLSRLVHLEVSDTSAPPHSDSQRAAFCWGLAPLTSTCFWPQPRKLTVPHGWLLPDSASGDDSAEELQSADADSSDMGQQLLVQLRERRPQLEVILKPE